MHDGVVTPFSRNCFRARVHADGRTLCRNDVGSQERMQHRVVLYSFPFATELTRRKVNNVVEATAALREAFSPPVQVTLTERFERNANEKTHHGSAANNLCGFSADRTSEEAANCSPQHFPLPLFQRLESL